MVCTWENAWDATIAAAWEAAGKGGARGLAMWEAAWDAQNVRLTEMVLAAAKEQELE